MYCGLWQSNVYFLATDFSCSALWRQLWSTNTSATSENVIVHDRTVTVVLTNNFCDTDLMQTKKRYEICSSKRFQKTDMHAAVNFSASKRNTGVSYWAVFLQSLNLAEECKPVDWFLSWPVSITLVVGSWNTAAECAKNSVNWAHSKNTQFHWPTCEKVFSQTIFSHAGCAHTAHTALNQKGRVLII